MKLSRWVVGCGLTITACSIYGTSNVTENGPGGSAPVTGSGGADVSQPVGTGGAGVAGGGGAGSGGSAGPAGQGGTGAAAGNDAGGESKAGLHITFPPSGAVSNDSIVVRGTSRFAESVSAIQVNGVPATSTDGFASYRTVVPLQMNGNKIVVTAEGANKALLGTAEVTIERFADDASIRRGGGDPFSTYRLFGMVIDTVQHEAIICDDIFDGLARIDFATGNRALASASESSARGMVGKGYNDIGQPRDVTIDAPGHALVIDGSTLVGIDLHTGDRTLLSGNGKGTGPEATQFGSVGYDQASARAIAMDYQGNALVAIDPISGARTVLSSATIGTGLALNSFGAVEVDPAHDRVLTTRPYANPIIAIDMKSGNRSVLSGDGAGTGPALQEPGALAISPSLGVVFAWDKSKHLFSIDLANGNRRIVADTATGMGVPLASLEHLAFGDDLLYGTQGESVLALDPIEGHRVVIAK